ncbi:MAG: acyl-CoA thioesterase [Deltaproteobacteria bacterium]|nr:acyl-CoA thioesterase [Deltaproteobacteria bacterium]
MTSISPFHWRRRVAMRDIDAFAVVWYGNYLQYCDEAATELLRAFDLAPASLPTFGVVPAVVRASCRYLAAARLDDEVDVRVQVRFERAARLDFSYEISRATDQTILAKIETTMVLLRQSGALVYLLPEPLRVRLQALLAAQHRSRP